MDSRTRRTLRLAGCWTGALIVLLAASATRTGAVPQQAQPSAGAKPAVKQALGTVQSINGRTITLAPASGAPITVTVQDPAKVLQVEPGETDLKKATPIQLSDIQVGDRVLLRGLISGDHWAVSEVVAMKHADLAAKQQATMEDWRKRGVGGLVSAVDPAVGTVDISVVNAGGAKTIAVHTDKNTIIRRYAPDSVKIQDARPGVLAQIKPGDQLQARGEHSADGISVAAEEIVSGAFRNISGTVVSVNPTSNSLTVNDLATKKPVVVDVGAQSQLRKLAPAMAQGIAARMRAASQPQSATGSEAPASSGARPAGAGRTGGAQADFQQVVNRSPAEMLSDLQKGDAVMIVGAPNESTPGVTAIMLVSGVEPILTAPNGGQGMTLAPWSLGGPADAEAGP